MPIRPTVPPRPSPGPRPGAGPGNPGNGRKQPTRNTPGGGRPGPSGRAPGAPVPPPVTPFQPGAPPSPPLVPIAAGVAGLLLLGKFLFDLLNFRNPDGAPEVPTGQRIDFGTVDQSIVITGTWSFPAIVLRDRFTNAPIGQTFGGLSGTWTCTGSGVGVTVSPASGEFGWASDGPRGFGRGTATFHRADGSSTTIGMDQPFQVFDPSTGPFGAVGTTTLTNTVGAITYNAVPYLPPSPEGPPVPDAVRSVVEGDLGLAAAPVVLPLVGALLPAVLPQAPPDGSPVPTPSTAPGGLPSGVPRRQPRVVPRPLTAPQPGGGRALPQGQPITAGGVRPQLPPAPGSTATGTTFLPGGRPLVGNGPRPTPEGIANELGKLEQKLEILLKPDDPLSPLELLNKIIDQTENIKFLLETLFPPEPYTFEPGFYQLSPICDRDAEGDLLPPRLAPWNGGEGEFTELRQRLDALAVLLQHHKDLKQPTCGPRGNVPASNVTVHFESD